MNPPALDIDLRLDRAGLALDAQLQLPEGGITVVFGASGAGKTTLLRAIAGLEPAASGRVCVAGAVWQDTAAGVCVPVWRRRVGYVFQEASLFDHLDVRGNLGYGLRWNPKPDVGSADLVSLAETLGIADLLNRRVDTLSGGERQRVAIARMLAPQPAVLLLDEPLAALDLMRREQILDWLKGVQRQSGTAMVYVTHSLDELACLADTAVILAQGRVAAIGAPEDALRAAGLSRIASRLSALRD